MSEEGMTTEEESSREVLWYDLNYSGYPWWPCRVRKVFEPATME